MYGTYCRLNVHVSASWRDVVRASTLKLNRKFRRSHKMDDRNMRKGFYRTMLDYHKSARELLGEYRFHV